MKKIIIFVFSLMIFGLAFGLFFLLAPGFGWKEIELASRASTASVVTVEEEQEREAEEEEKEEKEKNGRLLPLYEEKRGEFVLGGEDFLEIDLAEMKVRVYKKGLLVKEAEILTRGDAQSWGGTAAGLYEILRGYSNAYSVVSEVYMPWALHFYGKYYVHGEPYYPDGSPLISSVSGGCLRLKDEEAREIYELTEKGMPVLVIDKPRGEYQYPQKQTTVLPQVSAKSYLVADLGSGFVLAEKNAQEQYPIASLTKLMTATVVAENVDLTKSITIKEEMLEPYGTTDGLETGKRFRVIDLFYPLLIESSNDSAEVLSRFLGREKTIRLMNEKAEAIFMEKTEFICPSGYDPANVSTVQDLFYLARYVLNNRPPLLEITKSRTVRSFGDVAFDITELWNKNVFINDPTFVGGKTGFIRASKYTALFIFQLDTEDGVQRQVAIILLGSQNEELDTQRLYLWLLENYFSYPT